MNEGRIIARIIGVRLSMSLGMASVMPIIYPFWSSHGLIASDIVVLKVVLLVSILLCELPSGVIADYLGRRNSLVAAGLLLIAGEFLYLVGQGLTEFLMGEVLIAMGVSMITGTDQAALFESLRRSGRSHEFGRYFGWLRAAELLLGAGVTLTAGHMLVAWDRLPFAVAMIWFCLLAVLSMNLNSSRTEMQSHKEEERSIRQSLQQFPRNHKTVAILAFTALVFGLGPILKTFSQAFLSMHEVPIHRFGYAPAAGMFTGALVGVIAHRVIKYLGQQACLTVIAAVHVLALAVFSFGDAWSGQIAIVAYLTNEVFATIALSKLIQEEVSDSVRATAMSLVGMGSRACSLCLLFFFRKDGHENLQEAFLFSMLLTAIALVALLRLRFSQSSITQK